MTALRLDGAMDELDADLTADELLTLAYEREQALALADELETVALGLRAIVTGTATSLEITDVTGNIRPSGYLTIEAAFAWDLLIRYARPNEARP